MKVRVSPSRIFGKCPAGHQKGDEFAIDGTVIEAVKGPICYVALSAFTSHVTQIQRGRRVTSHLSCPGCGFGSELDNRVVFVLGSEEAWELSKRYSEYNWGRLDGRETETSKRDCDQCWQLTQAGKYLEAKQAIEKAMKHLKPQARCRPDV